MESYILLKFPIILFIKWTGAATRAINDLVKNKTATGRIAQIHLSEKVKDDKYFFELNKIVC